MTYKISINNAFSVIMASFRLTSKLFISRHAYCKDIREARWLRREGGASRTTAEAGKLQKTIKNKQNIIGDFNYDVSSFEWYG